MYERWRAEKSKNLDLQNQLRTTIEYEVKICTGPERGHGTNSRVYLELFGLHTQRRSGEHQLEHEPGPTVFKRRSVELFTLKSQELGALKAVHIWQDNSGTCPGWFLESVHVRRKAGTDELDNKWTDFPCHGWLATDKGQCRLATRLEAGKLTHKVIRSASSLLRAVCCVRHASLQLQFI
jgi:hypothetical protein